MNTVLSRDFYLRDTVAVAQELLGQYLVRKIATTVLVGKIVETEAYLAFDDPAAHNFVGKTLRNSVLFEDAGYTYVHGIRQYHCMDIVTEAVGVPGSVLLRAVEPLEGLELMRDYRGTDDILKLTSGPGKLCQAFQITREQNGVDVTHADSVISVYQGTKVDVDMIVIGKRVGITKAVDKLLRFSVKGSLFVSK